MKFKRLLIPSLLALCLFCLTSCDIEGFIKDNTSLGDIDPNEIIDNIVNGDPDYVPVDIDETNLDYGYLDLQRDEYGTKKGQLITFYTEIDNILADFMTNGQTLEPTSIAGMSDEYYIIKDQVSYSRCGLSYQEAASVYKCVLLDHPEYYFVSNTLVNGNYGSVYFLTLICDPDYANGELRTTYNNLIADYDTQVKSEIEGLDNPLQKVQAIHDYIAKDAEYAFKKIDGNYVKYNEATHSYVPVINKTNADPDDSSFAHNLLGIVNNHEGVCESYAELFHYLLKNNGIESIMVTGDAWTNLPRTGSGESHAWNYVKFNYVVGGETVSKWYGFDVTWDDPVPDVPNTARSTYFGCYYFDDNHYTFLDSHVPDANGDLSQGIDYLYKLPTLVEENLLTVH